MKKLITVIISLTLVAVTLVACSKANSNTNETTTVEYGTPGLIIYTITNKRPILNYMQNKKELKISSFFVALLYSFDTKCTEYHHTTFARNWPKLCDSVIVSHYLNPGLAFLEKVVYTKGEAGSRFVRSFIRAVLPTTSASFFCFPNSVKNV